MKTIILIVSILVSYNSLGFSQNLDSLPQFQRDSILITIAKDMIITYGKGYYREYKEPLIALSSIQPNIDNPENINVGRPFYIITYFYDPKKEKLNEIFAAEVRIWADTGIPMGVIFGNGYGIINKSGKKIKKDNITEVPFEEIKEKSPYDFKYKNK